MGLKMQLISFITAASAISAVAALDAYFLCRYEMEGKCCLHFNPSSGTESLCNSPSFPSPTHSIKLTGNETGGKATQGMLSIDPGSPSEWACLNNVDGMPACCYPHVRPAFSLPRDLI
jgi:hypothetical protein